MPSGSPPSASSSCRTAYPTATCRRRRRDRRRSADASAWATGRISCTRRSRIRTRGIAALVEMLAALDGDLALVLHRRRRRRRGRVMRGDARSAASTDRVVRTGRVADAERDALIAGADGARVPERVRGLRRAAGGGDGARHADRLQRAAGGPRGRRRRRRRRRRRASRPARRGRRPSTRPLDRRDELVAAGRVRRQLFTLDGVGRRRWPPAYRSGARRVGDEDHRAVPALRARHGADRRRDDAHRPRAGRAAGTSCTSSRRCRGTAPIGSSRVERPVDRRTERTDVGLGHPRPPVPGRRQVEPRPPRGRVRRLLGAGRPRRSARRRVVSASRCRAGDVAAAHARADRVAGRRRSGGRRWCSTCRTSSPTPRSARVRSRDRRVIALAALARADHLPPGGGGHRAQRRPARATSPPRLGDTTARHGRT